MNINMFKGFKVFLGFLCLCPLGVWAEDSLGEHFSLNTQIPLFNSDFNPGYTHEWQRQWRSGLIIGGYSALVAWYGYASWWQQSSDHFNVRYEHWFSEDSPKGGTDKLGHAYSTYLTTRLLTHGLRWAGYPHRNAIKIAGISATAIGLGIEILDGFTRDFGFSYEDFAMNLVGASLGMYLQRNSDLDEMVDFRLLYERSLQAKNLGINDPIDDYAGQTYLMIFKLDGIDALAELPVIKYLEFALGYGAKGYQPLGAGDSFPKERTIYYGISANLTKMFHDMTHKKPVHPTTFETISKEFLEYIQIPNTLFLSEIHL